MIRKYTSHCADNCLCLSLCKNYKEGALSSVWAFSEASFLSEVHRILLRATAGLNKPQ